LYGPKVTKSMALTGLATYKLTANISFVFTK